MENRGIYNLCLFLSFLEETCENDRHHRDSRYLFAEFVKTVGLRIPMCVNGELWIVVIMSCFLFRSRRGQRFDTLPLSLYPNDCKGEVTLKKECKRKERERKIDNVQTTSSLL